MAKRYPFNMEKHQHDIFFRLNRAKNEYDEKCYNGSITEPEEREYESLIDGLEDLMGYGTGIVWLTGKEWALANESAVWASAMRGGK